MKRFAFDVILGAAASALLFAVLLCTGCGGPAFTESGGSPETASTVGMVGEVAVACIPGERNECPCSNGAKGIQECNEKGSGYGSCACPAPVAVASADAAPEAAPRDPNMPPDWLLACEDTPTPSHIDVVFYDCSPGDPVDGGKPYAINGKRVESLRCYELPKNCFKVSSVQSPYDVQCNPSNSTTDTWECPR